MKVPVVAGAIALVSAILLSGCAGDPLADDYGGGDGYAPTEAAFSEFAPEDRGEPVVFEGTTDTGLTVSNEDYTNEVLVVNFWYAECAPCRAEAPDLRELSMKYDGKGASFLGINIYDQPENALAFARKFDISYPSIMDADSGTARLAFVGHAPPSAVPTTLVLDKEGRVAARFLGQLQARSNLDTIIRELVAEDV
jgi:thiol-disulfide isomerase/thioredoxin